MIGGLRLIDGVIIAAVALLVLKGLGFLSTPRPQEPVHVLSAANVAKSEELPQFARVLAHARSNYIAPEVGITGAVGEKEKSEAAAPVPEAGPKEAEPA